MAALSVLIAAYLRLPETQQYFCFETKDTFSHRTAGHGVEGSMAALKALQLGDQRSDGVMGWLSC